MRPHMSCNIGELIGFDYEILAKDELRMGSTQTALPDARLNRRSEMKIA